MECLTLCSTPQVRSSRSQICTISRPFSRSRSRRSPEPRGADGCSTLFGCMALTSRVWGAGKVVVLLAALGATYLLSALLSARLAMRAREVTVPDLAGRSVNDASAALEDLGLTLKVDENRRVDAQVPAGAILQQDPTPGVSVKRP